MQRIRITYAKGEELRYTGNLDMQKVWERTFRRAELNLAYSQGFHPQPKMHQACPLPLGFTSENDLLDFWLDSDEELAEIGDKLNKAIQPGITITELKSIPLEEKPLQTLVISAVYQIHVEEYISAELIANQVENLLKQDSCVRTRRGKEYDLLPLIESITITKNEPIYIEMTLAARPGAAGRPEEVLDTLGIDLSETSIVRTGLILSDR